LLLLIYLSRYGTTRRQRKDLFGCEIKLSHVTTSLSTQIKVEAIPLSALPKDTTSKLAGKGRKIFRGWANGKKDQKI